MRPRRFWTPRYVFDRSIEKAYRQFRPGVPWLTPAAIDLLESWLRPSDRVVEFGAGRSTIWFARRTAQVVSLETSPTWVTNVSSSMKAEALADRVALIEAEDDRDRYLDCLTKYAAASFDLALIDGGQRDLAAIWSIDHVASGGIVVVDNVERYLPSNTRSPISVYQPASDAWAEFAQRVKGWRHYWTSSGVTDTAFFFVP